jgi:hypothetical protein
MPLMDGRGHVLCGGGGLQGSLDGTPLPFATYGGGCWYDDRGTALEQLREPAPGTLAFWREAAAPALLPRGANDFAGGGGAFVAWLAGYGVWGSLEQRLAGTDEEIRAQLRIAGTCGPHAVAPDGTIGYVRDRANGYGLTLVAPSGRVVFAPGVPANFDIQVLGDGVAIWRGGAVGRPAPRPTLTDAQGLLLEPFNGSDWLLYWSEARGGLILQPDGDPYGAILEPRPIAFNPHLRVVDEALHITWSTTQGEGPNDLVVCVFDGARVFYQRTADGWHAVPPRWLDLSAPIPPPIERPIEPPPTKPPIEPPPTKPPIEPPPTRPPVEPPPVKPTFPPPISPIEVSMTPYNVAVVGPNGLYGSVDPTTKLLTFDRETVADWETFTLEAPDDRGRLQFTSHSAPDHIIGVDTTQYGSNDVRKLFYMKPITNPDGSPGRGNYESFFVGKTPEKLIVAMIEYIDQGVRTVPYAAPNLTVVEL